MMPTRLTRRLRFAGLLVPLLLAGCGGLVKLPNSGPAPSLYNLTPIDSAAVQPVKLLLRIEDPTVGGGLDTPMIARRSSPNELQYFAGVRWSGRPGEMLQNVLVQSFENIGQDVTEARGGAVVPAQYELQVDVRDFQAEYYHGATTPTVHVRLALKLVRLGPLGSAGQRVVDETVQAGGADMAAVVAAFDQAAHQALQETLGWTLARLTPGP
ncbi:MAG: hypothetical protein GC201_02555 [Alphaproteobacteria bacterium]|nr:hypothetical protein [Alphaproteobacteria bacterium]